ncbi:MAG TPA: bifunctional 4-hydroxy-2-oxoglutarate aldolase/2-dehydro-3-deoxy-phosphogluconate aldolase [Limnobacter sp.]|nr:bifunctional 4-hydroxy-2-oxoglutarate aldolase/2-dehydro-3-deoxy-phosphogluconate aldolase [Limnobacter sp.]
MNKPPHTPDRIEYTHTWLSQGVLPVVVVHSPKQGLEIAEGLLQGGIDQMEITLRTPDALQAMREIAKHFPTMKLSAGTVLQPEQFEQAADAGASLFISPGLTETLAAHALKHQHAWVPGVATASEVMRALELGFELLKFFPAMAAGGPKALAGITAALSSARVVPTGGVTVNNLQEWRSIPAVQAVGGTWITAGLEDGARVAPVVAQRAAQALAAWHGHVLV